VSSKQLSALVSAVRAETDASKQELAARKIPILLDEADLGGIDAKTLQDLAALLDMSNDPVRRWVALSLSMFDRRAQFAVTRLMVILGSIDCAHLKEPGQTEAIRLADTLRFAIRSIGGPSMPGPVCLLKLRAPENAWREAAVAQQIGAAVREP
jgi:hypothetical protein